MPFIKGNTYTFKPGNGFGKGRPRMSDTEKQAAKLAREHAERAMNRVLTLIDASDEKLQFAAAKEVLDRALGRAATTIVGDPERPLHSKTEFSWKSPASKLTTSQESVSPLGTSDNSDGA